MELITVVEELDRLLEADGDEEADADGGNVDEKIVPGACCVMGGVDVEHRGLRWWMEISSTIREKRVLCSAQNDN
jgi:hypothetical protein